MKKAISVLLSVILTLCAISADVCYANDEINYTEATHAMFSYSKFSSYVRLDSYTGSNENLYIPQYMTIDGEQYQVRINSTFDSNQTIKNIMFENGVYVFAVNRLFYGCTNLETALIEYNGNFTNAGNITKSTTIFANCSSLKEYFDLSQFTASSELKMYGCESLEHITSLPSNITNFEFFTSAKSNSLSTIDCDIPESCTSLYVQGQNLSGELIINSHNLKSLKICSSTTSPYFNTSSLTVKVPNNSTTLNTALKYVASGRHTIKVETLDGSCKQCYNNIYILGDSLSTSDQYYYNNLVNSVDDKTILNKYAVEGDTTKNLLSRVGATQITVESDFTIPADKTAVPISLSDYFTNSLGKVSQDTSGINCVNIDGVEGFITYNSNDGCYYFSRSTVGDEVAVQAGTIVVTEFQQSYYKGDKLIIYIGTNDYAGGMTSSKTTVQNIINEINKIIDYTNCSDYIVVGVAFRTKDVENKACSTEKSATYENMMSEEYGNRFLNLREYFINNAYSICSDLEIDDEEQAELDKGIIPAEFYNDGTHWNSETGAKVVSQAIYEKMVSIDGFINVSGHKEVVEPDIQPTCTQDGLRGKSYCKICGETINCGTKIDAIGHNFSNKVVQPTCDSVGYTLHTCDRCDYKYADEFVDKVGHTLSTKVNKATVTENGSVVVACENCNTVLSQEIIYSPNTINLSATSFTYNGKAKKPTVTVVDSNGQTVSSSDYKVIYSSGCKNVGSYKITVKFKGNYSGTLTKTYKINPKNTTISSVTAKSKGFTVKWKKQTAQTTGYQIQYSTSSNFKNAKMITVSKNSATSKTVSNLIAKKKYYVRIRTYKVVNNKKYYSSWSKAKSITTK